MAALAHYSCVWAFVLGMCVMLVAGTDCGKECALCVYQLLGQKSGFSSLVIDEFTEIFINIYNKFRDKIMITIIN